MTFQGISSLSLVGIAGPNIVGRDRHGPHAFTEHQMGHYDVGAS